MIEEALRTKLLAYTSLTAIISQRLYIDHLPQDPTLPAMSYFIVNQNRHNDIDVAMADVQIDGWASTYAAALNIQQNSRFAIQREKGIWSTISVLSVVLDFENIDYEPDTKIYHSISQFRIKYREE